MNLSWVYGKINGKEKRIKMGVCKCGLSAQYPECDGTHKEVGNNEILRQSIIQAYKKWEASNSDIV